MGRAAEILKNIIDENKSLNESKAPDPATRSTEYVEHRKKVRMIGRKLGEFRTAFMDAGFTLEQVLSVRKQLLGEEKVNKFLKEMDEPKHNFWYTAIPAIEKAHPELIEALSEKERKAYNSGYDEKRLKIKEWIRKGKLTQEEFDDTRVRYLITCSRFLGAEGEKLFYEQLDNMLPPDKQQEIADRLESYRDVNEYSEEDKLTYPKKTRIRELENNIPAAILNDQQKLGSYKHALEYADAHLSMLKKEVRDEAKSIESDTQKIEAELGYRTMDKLIPEYEGGIYHELYEKNAQLDNMPQIKKERQEDFKKLMEDGAEISNKTADGLRSILKKMEEMGLENYHHEKSGEDGYKIYGFNKVYATKQALEAAIDDGDPDEIIRCSAEYEKTMNDMREMYDTAKECFLQDPYIHVGNLDSIRNEAMPPEFVTDVHTTAQINSIYLTYRYLKDNGINLEEYLKNPTKKIVENAYLKFSEKSFQTLSRGLELEDCLDLMSSTGRFANADNDLGNVVPFKGFGRVLETAHNLESDEKLKAKHDIYSYAALDNYENVIIAADKKKFQYFSGDANDELKRRNRIRTLQNLMLMNDQERDANICMDGVPGTDFNGALLKESFDTAAAISRKPADYYGITDRVKRMLTKARDIQMSGESKGPGQDNVLEAAQELYISILLNNAADKDTPGYRMMERELRQMYPQLSKNADAAQKSRMKEKLEAFMPEKPEEEKQKAWEDPVFAEVYRKSGTPDLIFKLMKDQTKEMNYSMEILNQFSEADLDPDMAEERIRLETMQSYDEKEHAVIGDNQLVTFSKGVRSKQMRERIEKGYADVASEMKRVKKTIREPRAARYYDDMIMMTELDPVSLASIHAESPYVKNFAAIVAMTVNMEKENTTPEQLREALGTVYDDHLDLVHYGLNTHRIEKAHRDTLKKLKKEGKQWGEKEEKEYTDKIKENHANIINAYERLLSVHIPEDTVSKYMGNPLPSSLGNGPASNRDILRHVAYMKGELQALKLGWNSEDMAILGFMAGVDAQISKYLRYGNAEEKRGLAEAEKDMRLIMDRFYNKKVETNADKKEVCDALRNFADKYENVKALSILTENRKNFERKCDAVDKAAIRTYKRDHELSYYKRCQTLGYLKEVEKVAVKENDIGRLAQELIRFAAEEENLSPENRKAFNDYLDGLLAVDEKGNFKKGGAFYEKLCDEINRQYYDNTIELTREAERIAARIRNGEAVTDPLYDGIRTDYETSRYMADMSLKNSGIMKLQNGSGMLRDWLKRVSPLGADDKLVFDERDIKSRQEYTEYSRKRLLTEGMERYAYGNADAKNPKNMSEEERKRHFDEAYERAAAFHDKMEIARNKAILQYEELTQLKDHKSDNSKEFMKMYQALEKVCRLDIDASPAAVINAYDELNKAAAGYRAKIDGQTFANIKGNGQQRYSKAAELMQLADEKSGLLKEAAGGIAYNELLSEQIMKAQKNAGKAGAEIKADNKGGRKERRKLDQKEVKEMLGNKEKAPGRGRSKSEPTGGKKKEPAQSVHGKLAE